MIIEFPKKYDVRMHGYVSDGAFISIPGEHRQALIDTLNQQDWIQFVFTSTADLHVLISAAYEISAEQAHAALCQLCEHVMSPPVDVDREVWGDVLGEMSE